jgi:hypothetical protein
MKRLSNVQTMVFLLVIGFPRFFLPASKALARRFCGPYPKDHFSSLGISGPTMPRQSDIIEQNKSKPTIQFSDVNASSIGVGAASV